MMELKESEEWDYLNENFSISKSKIPLSAIGLGHAMEQENKVLKVIFCFQLKLNFNYLIKSIHIHDY